MSLRIFILIILSNVAPCFGISDKEYASMPKLFHLDDYDECMLLEEEALYCTFTFELHPLSEEKQSDVWLTIKNVSMDPRNYRHDLLRHGICVPKSCTSTTEDQKNISLSETIETCYNKKYENLGLNGNVLDFNCEKKRTTFTYDFYDIVVGVVFISYSLVVLLSSIYEGVARYQKKDIYERITNTTGGKMVAAFSLPKNWQRLKSSNTNADAEKLRSIQGMRCYTLICVILTHTVMVTFGGPVSNTQYTEAMTAQPLNMFLANGNFAVQTFFVISGWLLSFHFFEMMKNRQVFNLKYIIVAVVNRYIRLTPVLVATIAFQSTWLVHMGRGPNWDSLVVDEYRNCRKNWWTNLLYVNNYINKNNMCLVHTWYIAADTQLYVFSLILLTIVWKYEKKVQVILGTTMVIGLVIPGAIAFFKNYEIVIRQYPETLYKMEGVKQAAWHHLYSSGYSNITGYTIGLAFGYIFYKNRNKVIAVKKVHIILWWILTFGMCNFIVLIAARMYEPNYESSPTESALYWAFGKNIFALGIAIGIYGFTQKIGWFVRWFCEWRAVSVIGRLTYSTYIVHTSVVRIRGGLIRSPVYVNDYVLILTTLGDIVASYLVGTIVCLMFEMPISALQKLVMPQMGTKRLEDSSEKPLGLDETDAENGKETICSKV